MTRFQKGLFSVLCMTAMVCGMLFVSSADGNNELSSYTLISNGRYDYDGNKDGDYNDAEDIIISSADIASIANKVRTGKGMISSALNTYPNVETTGFDTFSSFADKISGLSEFPEGVYFYDSATGTEDVSTLMRYKKVDGEFFPCNEYGEVTSNTAAAVLESNLVSYSNATYQNLAIGKAGIVNKEIVLGNGHDVTEYLSQLRKGKQLLADAITEAGVPTSNTDSFEVMEENILLLGQNAIDPTEYEVIFHYHEHEGTPGTVGGCYKSVTTPAGSGTCTVSLVNTGQTTSWTCYNCGQYTGGVGVYRYKHNNCGQPDVTWYKGTCQHCGKTSTGGNVATNHTYSTPATSKIVLGCGKTEKTVEWYEVIFK